MPKQDLFDFSHALYLIRRDKKVARRGWNGKDMWLAIQYPDSFSKMTLPYVYMRTAMGGFVPWLCSQGDLLSQDWYEVE
jgi:hypothetical protein